MHITWKYNRNKLELTKHDIHYDISNRWRERKTAINFFKIAFNDLNEKYPFYPFKISDQDLVSKQDYQGYKLEQETLCQEVSIGK